MDAVTSRRSRRAVTAAHTDASGLATPAARGVMIFVWACAVASGVIGGDFSPLHPGMAVAYVLGLVGSIVLTDPRDAPLTGIRAVLLPVISLTMTVAILTATTTAVDRWLLGFAGYLMALQALRGNLVLGFGGGAAQVVIVVTWGISTGQEPGGVASMLTLSVSSFALCVVWRTVLSRLVRRERAHRSATAEAERQIAAAEAARHLYQSELDTIRDDVRPVLLGLRDGVVIDEEVRVEIAVREAEIRDRIRSPRLRHPVLVAAAERARRRGITVTLLAESAGDRTVTSGAADAIATALDGAEAGAAVVVSVDTREPDVIHLVADASGTVTRTTIDDV